MPGVLVLSTRFVMILDHVKWLQGQPWHTKEAAERLSTHSRVPRQQILPSILVTGRGARRFLGFLLLIELFLFFDV